MRRENLANFLANEKVRKPTRVITLNAKNLMERVSWDLGLYVLNFMILGLFSMHDSCENELFHENLASETASGYNPKRDFSNERGLIGP